MLAVEDRIPIHHKALALISGVFSDRKPGKTSRWAQNMHCKNYRVFILFITPVSTFAADLSPSEPYRDNKESYVHHVFAGPAPVVKAAAGAGLSQARGKPAEWGGGVGGYAKRFGSAFGKHVVKSSIHYGVARLMHEELDYQPSEKRGVRARLQYALVSTVITRKTTTGKRTVSTGEIAGVIGSGLISRLWQPASLHTAASGFGSAGISLGADAGFNVVREFWPEIRHPRRRKVSKSAAATHLESAR